MSRSMTMVTGSAVVAALAAMAVRPSFRSVMVG
jgi:hypothetical protein